MFRVWAILPFVWAILGLLFIHSLDTLSSRLRPRDDSRERERQPNAPRAPRPVVSHA